MLRRPNCENPQTRIYLMQSDCLFFHSAFIFRFALIPAVPFVMAWVKRKQEEEKKYSDPNKFVPLKMQSKIVSNEGTERSIQFTHYAYKPYCGTISSYKIPIHNHSSDHYQYNKVFFSSFHSSFLYFVKVKRHCDEAQYICHIDNHLLFSIKRTNTQKRKMFTVWKEFTGSFGFGSFSRSPFLCRLYTVLVFSLSLASPLALRSLRIRTTV